MKMEGVDHGVQFQNNECYVGFRKLCCMYYKLCREYHSKHVYIVIHSLNSDPICFVSIWLKFFAGQFAHIWNREILRLLKEN